MDYNNSDIIIARATPIGNAALGVIRISGPNILGNISQFLSVQKPKPRHAYVGTLKSPNTNQPLDSCVFIYYAAPKSYTGEDMLEISCHGSNILIDAILNEFVLFGIRMAYPGEFSYRAFQNNKIDLMQAESIAEKISSNTDKYGVLLQNMEKGGTSKHIQALREDVVNVLCVIEHELDFNEEEIAHLKRKEIIKILKNINNKISEILSLSEQVKILDAGYKVIIIGYPNVGKSTLFNTIIGQDKAIVTPMKGTTRDILEVDIKISGVPITLYDTAGYRGTKNEIEILGIKKSLKLMQRANVMLIVDDKDPQEVQTELLEKNYISSEQQIILIKNKCDNIENRKGRIDKKIYKISAKNNIGINALLTKLSTLISLKIEKVSSDNVFLCNARQISLFKKAHQAVQRSIENLRLDREMDIIASELQGFVSIMDEMLGKMASNEVLNKIFQGFCVGK